MTVFIIHCATSLSSTLLKCILTFILIPFIDRDCEVCYYTKKSIQNFASPVTICVVKNDFNCNSHTIWVFGNNVSVSHIVSRPAVIGFFDDHSYDLLFKGWLHRSPPPSQKPTFFASSPTYAQFIIVTIVL